MDLKVTNEQHLQSSPVKERFDLDKKARLAKASKDFESILTQMMLKSMNQTTEGGLFGDGEGKGLGGDVYGGLFEMEIAKHISNKKGLGIADMIFKKVTGDNMNDFEKVLAAVKYDREAKAGFGKKSGIEESADGEKIKINIKDLENRKFSPSSDSLKRLDKYDNYINEASKTFGVDKNIIRSVILTESAGNPKAVSKAKAKGLMQLIDSTAEDMGVANSFDPKQNILGGTKYLAKMLRQYSGDLKLSLAAYNAGPQNVEKHNGVPPFDETKSYIARVLGYFNYLNE